MRNLEPTNSAILPMNYPNCYLNEPHPHICDYATGVFEWILLNYFGTRAHIYSYWHHMFTDDGDPFLQVVLRPNPLTKVVFQLCRNHLEMASYTRPRWNMDYKRFGNFCYYRFPNTFELYITDGDMAKIYSGDLSPIDVWCLRPLVGCIIEMLPPPISYRGQIPQDMPPIEDLDINPFWSWTNPIP